MIKKAVYLESAPAKINLYLEVLPKEPEAEYHDLRTVFQAIDLRDYLTFEILMESSEDRISEEVDFEITLDSNNDTVRGLAVNNSVVRAVEVFFTSLPEPVVEQVSRVELSVFIDKQIPLEGGLAGGSANAAATLRVLNRFIRENFNCEVSQVQLLDMALELGSDVPFCLQSLEQPRVYAEGRGEKIIAKDLSAYDEYQQVILVKPKFGVNTAEAYAKLSPELAKQKAKPPYFNSFEKTVFRDYPELKRIKSKLLELGCAQALLSGSGSTVLGFVDKNQDADVIYQDIINHCPENTVYISKMLS